MSRRKAALLIAAFVLLVLVAGVVWVFVYAKEQPLSVTFLTVGQGDAIFIETPSGRQILVDGGPDRSVLRELPRVMGPLDRSIDIVVATHPDRDHIAGLADVFQKYDVDTFIDPQVQNDTSYAQALSYAAGQEEGVVQIAARRGTRIHLDTDVYLDVLFPDRDVDTIETNTGSVVMQLVYGESEFLLSGDAPSQVEDWLVLLDGEGLQSDVLKAGHHGSRTSTSEGWIRTVDPRYVVVSAGAGNSYGHPHEEVVTRITESGAIMLDTMERPVTFRSDGKAVWVK